MAYVCLPVSDLEDSTSVYAMAELLTPSPPFSVSLTSSSPSRSTFPTSPRGPNHPQFQAISSPDPSSAGHDTIESSDPLVVGAEREGEKGGLEREEGRWRRGQEEGKSRWSLGKKKSKKEGESTVWTRAAKVYLASTVCFVSTTIGLIVALEIAQATSNQAVVSRFNFYLQVPVILAQLFLMFAAVQAVRGQNMVLIAFVTGLNVYLILSGIIEAAERTAASGQPRDRIYPTIATPTASQNHLILAFLWSIPASDALFEVGVAWSAWRMFEELGWSSYKRISASVVLRTLYRRVLILRSLLLFSLFFAVLQTYVLPFTGITLTEATRNNVDEFRPIPADIMRRNGLVGLFVGFLSLYTLALGATAIAVRRERRELLFVGLLGQIAYVAFSSYSVYFLYEVDHLFSRLTGDGDSAVLLPVKTIFQTLWADGLVLSTLVYSIWVGLDFGRGLKDVLDRKLKPDLEHQIDLS